MQYPTRIILLLKLLAGAVLSLLLSGCFQVQLNGPVGGASVTLARADQPDVILQTVTSKTEADLIAEYGETAWAAMPDRLKRAYLGTAEFDSEQIEDYRLYLVTATGGVDYDFDHDGVIDAPAQPVIGSWHALLHGRDLKAVNTKVNLLTEAIYRIVGDRSFGAFLNAIQIPPGSAIWSATGPVSWDVPFGIATNGVRFAYTPIVFSSGLRGIPSVADANAARLLEDVTRDGVASYEDALRWSRDRHGDRYRREEAPLNALAMSIADGDTLAEAEILSSVFGAVPIAELAFEDESLATCISDGVGFWRTYLRYAHEVTDLNCLGGLTFSDPILVDGPAVDIDSLGGIEALTELRYLNLGQQDVQDVGPLASLGKLEWLSLEGNPVPADNLPQLGQITSLRSLNLSGLPLPDASWLSPLQQLEELRLEGPDVSLDSVLDTVPQLAGLSLLELGGGAAGESDLPRLAQLSGIQQLALSHNEIESLAGFPALPQLRALDLRGNRLTSLDGLPTLPSLSRLGLSSNALSTLDGVERQTALAVLLAGDNVLSSLPDLSTLDELVFLDLEENALTSLEGVSGLASLSSLFLTANQLESLAGLTGLPSLATLHAGDNELTDISDAAPLAALVNLTLDNNALVSLGPLADLTSLRTLLAANNDISSADGLEGMSELRALDLSGNRMTGIDALLELSQWIVLDLSDNPELPCDRVLLLQSDQSYARVNAPQCGVP